MLGKCQGMSMASSLPAGKEEKRLMQSVVQGGGGGGWEEDWAGGQDNYFQSSEGCGCGQGAGLFCMSPEEP